MSGISRPSARLLPNKTIPIPRDADRYIISLSVFHDIHCLVSTPHFSWCSFKTITIICPVHIQNGLRKALHPDYYLDPATGTIDGMPKEDFKNHINHCIDALRQTILCTSDTRQVFNFQHPLLVLIATTLLPQPYRLAMAS